MRALYCQDWQPFNDLEIADLPDPAPPEKGLRIRVLAAGVSFAQSLVVQGKYQRKPPLPFTPGSEVAGIVEALWAPVPTRFKEPATACSPWSIGAAWRRRPPRLK